MPAPPVTSSVWPETKDARGDARLSNARWVSNSSHTEDVSRDEKELTRGHRPQLRRAWPPDREGCPRTGSGPYQLAPGEYPEPPSCHRSQSRHPPPSPPSTCTYVRPDVSLRGRSCWRRGSHEPCLDKAERDGVRAHAERTPLLADRLRETDDGGLGRGVVGLADVPVEAGCRRNVNDRAVLSVALKTRPSEQRRVRTRNRFDRP